MTIDQYQIGGETQAFVRDLIARGAGHADLGSVLLTFAVAEFYRYACQARSEMGQPSLVAIGPEQVNEICAEAAELIGERLDDAEADLAERN